MIPFRDRAPQIVHGFVLVAKIQQGLFGFFKSLFSSVYSFCWLRTHSLWLSSNAIEDPSWITFAQLYISPGWSPFGGHGICSRLLTWCAGPNSVLPAGVPQNFQNGDIITQMGSQTFPQNIYHYFELLVQVSINIFSTKKLNASITFHPLRQGGDDLQAADSRRDLVYYSLVSPDSMQVAIYSSWPHRCLIPVLAQVSKGQIVPSTENSAKLPAYDFYVGQDCIPTVLSPLA